MEYTCYILVRLFFYQVNVGFNNNKTIACVFDYVCIHTAFKYNRPNVFIETEKSCSISISNAVFLTLSWVLYLLALFARVYAV